jgi:hypothetical protein
MEMNVRNLRIKSQPTPVNIMVDQKQLDNVEYFIYLNSLITNYFIYAGEIQSTFSMAKAAFNKAKTFSGQQIELNFKEETIKVLHLKQSFVWC